MFVNILSTTTFVLSLHIWRLAQRHGGLGTGPLQLICFLSAALSLCFLTTPFLPPGRPTFLVQVAIDVCFGLLTGCMLVLLSTLLGQRWILSSAGQRTLLI